MDVSAVRIRPSATEDTSKLADLSSQLGYAAPGAGSRLAEIRRQQDHAVLVAELDDAGVCGFAHVFTAWRITSPPFAELGALVVDESLRGRGIGSRLLMAAEDWARSHSLTRLRVRTRIERQRAVAFYERAAYRKGKTQHVLEKEIGPRGAMIPRPMTRDGEREDRSPPCRHRRRAARLLDHR